MTPLAQAAAAAFPRLDLTGRSGPRSPTARGCPLPPGSSLRAGRRKRRPAGPGPPRARTGPAAVFGPDGELIALMREEGGQARSLAVFVP